MKKIPFSEDELKVVGEHLCSPAWRKFRVPVKYNYPIPERENIGAAVNHEIPMWMPTNSDTTRVESRINKDHIARAEINDLGPEQPLEEKGGPDLFGIEWEFVPVAGGSMVRPGNPRLLDANEWYDKIVFPDIDALDWDGMAKLNAPYRNDSRSVGATFQNGLFERLISFMEFENAVVAMIDDDQKQAIHDLFSKLCDMYEKFFLHYQEAIGIVNVYFHDDWGSQKDCFFSLDTCEEMLVPYMRRLTDFCHAHGMWFELHSCGKNEKLVPAMIDSGIDVWAGQPHNDKEMLYEKYGDKIILGMNLPTLPQDASDEEIKDTVKQVVDKYAPGFPEKPVILSGFGATQKFNEELYRQSRQAFYKMM